MCPGTERDVLLAFVASGGGTCPPVPKNMQVGRAVSHFLSCGTLRRRDRMDESLNWIGGYMTNAGSIYGRTSDEWEEMREAAERFLISVAEQRSMTDYSSLNHAISEQTGYRTFDYAHESERAAIGRLLGEISLKTNKEHGVMLSALVTHQGSNDEGAGFYKLAAELGKMPKKPTEDDKLEALVRLVHEVHQQYAR